MKSLFLILLLPTLLFSTMADKLFMANEDHLQIIVNNRVVAQVNGKAITVIDVMKRMDILFLRQFPEYTHSVSARYQFYQTSWKRILSELIDKELILADAQEMKMEVSSGDVRQEMEELFGPNIILNLNKMDLSLEEATKIISGDILIRRMMFIKVTAKAMGKVTPQALSAAYEAYSKENATPATLTYQMITLRDQENGEALAREIYKGLYEEHRSLDSFTHPSLSISKMFTHTEKEIAPQNKEVLLNLKAGEVSLPVKQTSRDDSIVWRLFLVTKRDEGKVPTYQEAEPRLKEGLLDIAMTQEQKSYLNRLRRHFAVSEAQLKALVPDEFVPFQLK